jgi:hypothetical protein
MTFQSHALRSELDRWPMPRFVSGLGARDCMTGLAPSIARVASGPAAPKIQQPLALRVEVKEAEHLAARRWIQWALAADEFVVRHAAVGQDYGSPRRDPFSRAERKARSEHHRVQQIAFLSQVARHGAVVERTRQRRDEVEVTGGSTLQKAATRNFDDHVDLGRLKGVPVRSASIQVCIVHRASISREQPRGMQWPDPSVRRAEKKNPPAHQRVRRQVVEARRIELPTFALRTRRSPS